MGLSYWFSMTVVTTEAGVTAGARRQPDRHSPALQHGQDTAPPRDPLRGVIGELASLFDESELRSVARVLPAVLGVAG